MRIDLMLASAAVDVLGVAVDRDARRSGSSDAAKPSDHAPLIADLC